MHRIKILAVVVVSSLCLIALISHTFSVEQLRNSGYRALDEKKYQDAANEFGKAITIAVLTVRPLPEQYLLYQQYGWSLLLSGKHAEAKIAFNEALNIANRRFPEYREANPEPRAMAVWEEIHAPVYRGLAVVAAAQNDWGASAQWLEKVRHAHVEFYAPMMGGFDSTELTAQIGIAYWRAGNLSQARTWLQQTKPELCEPALRGEVNQARTDINQRTLG